MRRAHLATHVTAASGPELGKTDGRRRASWRVASASAVGRHSCSAAACALALTGSVRVSNAQVSTGTGQPEDTVTLREPSILTVQDSYSTPTPRDVPVRRSPGNTPVYNALRDTEHAGIGPRGA
jgi:hypothetical protein